MCLLVNASIVFELIVKNVSNCCCDSIKVVAEFWLDESQVKGVEDDISSFQVSGSTFLVSKGSETKYNIVGVRFRGKKEYYDTFASTEVFAIGMEFVGCEI